MSPINTNINILTGLIHSHADKQLKTVRNEKGYISCSFISVFSILFVSLVSTLLSKCRL